MKNKFLLCLSIVFLFGMVSQANALTLDFNKASGWIGSANPSNENPSGEAVIANILIGLGTGYVGTIDDIGYFRSDYDTTALDTVVLAGHDKQDKGDTSYQSSGYDYIFGKYGTTGYLWYVDGFVGEIILPDDGLNKNGLSHTTAFNGAPSVPEPSTVLLLGIGLLGIIGCSRRVKK